MRSFILLSTLALGWSLPFGLELPPSLNRWLHNPRRQTSDALLHLENQQFEEASQRLDRAQSLEPENPQISFNAGTGRLLAGEPEKAQALLEESAQDPAWLTSASYNLGNSYLEAEAPAAAVEAYKRALRADPTHQGAKFNLELALRQLEQQERQKSIQKDPQESPQGQEEGEEERSENRGDERPPDQQQPPEPDPQSGNQEDTQDAESSPQPENSSDRLPQFEDQPEMTADEAAAILQAVENLEKEQRRAEIARRQKETGKGEKDW